jgi:uncharacterized protein YkwD
MRRVISLALPFALSAIPVLLMYYASLLREQQPQMDATQPQIVMHILLTPTLSKAGNVRQSPVSALPTPTVDSTATDVARPASKSSAAASATIETVAPAVTPTVTITSLPEPTDVPSTVATSILSVAPEADWQDGVRYQLLHLHNRTRAESGLPPYWLSLQLQQAAQLQADYLASKSAAELMQLGLLGHQGPNGETVATRAALLGYPGSQVRENWAYFNNAQEAFDFWISDPWHRPQVMSGDLSEVGFGIAMHPQFGMVFVAMYGRQ